MAIEVGQEAPDFTLKDQSGEDVTLSSYRGQRNVVLVFFPAAFSPVCTTQLTEVGTHEGRYEDSDAQVLGISVDHHYAQSAFAGSLGLGATKLLADFEPKGEVSKRYGVYLDAAGLSGRATFVVDKRGVVRDRQLTDSPLDMPDAETYFAALSTCAA